MKPSNPAVRAARAALTALAASALTASAAHAYGGPGSYDPRTKPTVYPGTSTEVQGWKGVGSGGSGSVSGGTYRWGGSQVLIAPRWVLSSQHTRLEPGGWYNGPTDHDAGVVATYNATQATLPEASGFPLNWQGKADVSLSYLDTALPAPPGGFPKLLRDPVGVDLPGVLPGYVLWAGQGGTPGDNVPRVGWTTPNGLNAPGLPGQPSPGRVFIGDGDSGSTGLWYKSPTATPVIAGITTHAIQSNHYSQPTPYTARLATTDAGQPTTLMAWMDEQFAKHAGPPQWTTLAQEGVSFAALKPPAARKINVSWTLSGTATVKWAPPTTSVPTTGYRVTASPGGHTVTAAGTATSVDISGLQLGTTYTFTVTPFNGSGDAPRAAKTPIGGLTTWTDTTVSDAAWVEPNSAQVRLSGALTVQSTPTVKLKSDSGQAFTPDYCAQLTWTPQPLTDGSTPKEYRLLVQGEEWVVTAGQTQGTERWRQLDTLADGRHRVSHCGLAPGALVGYSISTQDGLNQRPATLGVVRTLTGPANGTSIPVTSTVTPQRAITDEGTVDYCATIAWEPLPAIGGVAANPTSFYWSGGGDGGWDEAPASGTSLRKCGLVPAEEYTFIVHLAYDGVAGIPSPINEWVDTPAGAATGTVLPAPTGVTTSARAAMATGDRVDYCATAQWTAAASTAGFPVTAYRVVLMKGLFEVVTEDVVPASWTSREFCGLAAGTSYIASISAIYEGDDGEPHGIPGAPRGVATPAGPAAGTLWPKSTITAVSSPVTVSGKLCVTLTWNTPTAVTGYPVQHFTLMVRSASTLVQAPIAVGSSVRTRQVCNVLRGSTYRATLSTTYGSNISPYTTRDFTVPTV